MDKIEMADTTGETDTLEQLLNLQKIDEEIAEYERELDQKREEVAAVDDAVTALESEREQIESEMERLRKEVRSGERAIAEKRDDLDDLRSKMDAVQNERQYSAATLESDMIRRDLRSLEDQVLERMEKIEEHEKRKAEIDEQLEEARSQVSQVSEGLRARQTELEEQIAIKRDRRENLAMRLDKDARQVYKRIRAGLSDVALAPLTEEGVCGNCYTAVTSQHQMEIKTRAQLICCEGCGVILYPEEELG